MLNKFEEDPAKHSGKDVPLPGKETTKIIKFTDRQKEQLKNKGYLIYPLYGQTLASLRIDEHTFSSKWHEGKAIERLAALKTEVAIDPNNLFLKDSDRRNLWDQKAMVSKFAGEIGRVIRGVTAILGGAPDYAELAFAHLAATGVRLFGDEYHRNVTRTTTPVDSEAVVCVGPFDAKKGLRIESWEPVEREADYLWAAPLVVPAAAVRR